MTLDFEEMIQRILEEAERDLSPYHTEEGGVIFETSAHIVTGTKKSKVNDIHCEF